MATTTTHRPELIEVPERTVLMIERLHAFIQEQGLRPSRRHHEIYLSDMRRTAPERWRTVIRQPVTA